MVVAVPNFTRHVDDRRPPRHTHNRSHSIQGSELTLDPRNALNRCRFVRDIKTKRQSVDCFCLDIACHALRPIGLEIDDGNVATKVSDEPYRGLSHALTTADDHDPLALKAK